METLTIKFTVKKEEGGIFTDEDKRVWESRIAEMVERSSASISHIERVT